MTPHEAIRLFAKTLENLEKWMDKAEEHAKDRAFEVDVLAQARLAPDQYAFVQQVQSACDQAKYAAAYLSGAQAAVPPRHGEDVRRAAPADPEVHAYLASVAEKDFAGADERKVAPPWLGGRWFTRQRLPRRDGDPELLLPRDDGVRDPAPQRRRARQDGLHRRDDDPRSAEP